MEVRGIGHSLDAPMTLNMVPHLFLLSVGACTYYKCIWLQTTEKQIYMGCKQIQVYFPYIARNPEIGS